MTPDQALTELRAALETALMVGLPMLLTVLVIGVVLGIVQAATQINEPTIAFVAKAISLALLLAAAGAWMLGRLVDFTINLYQRIPQLIS
ncbi:flagellar biosynthetic protein FliQ [Pseudomarimonas salicorniae]|uniref:Flagellar biosynthetic protein FliQ n=1 Tax=Pseudomarimonas salicorniae TaxID=2933270 RepID=A0ABT0GM93_9GAMM|nr:flagellar biosynthetic protein FliQ [Lysobacter sp. CAU 1642]MCK7595140.1 flagellar biosynthetic protein FliQ [Lysobacter sp. CAU 1642]